VDSAVYLRAFDSWNALFEDPGDEDDCVQDDSGLLGRRGRRDPLAVRMQMFA
jgi:hypothetical protein